MAVTAACVGDASIGEGSLATAAGHVSTTSSLPAPPAKSEEPASDDGLLVWADRPRAGARRAPGEEFSAATGVPVVIEVRDLGDIRATLAPAARGGRGPDVFVGAHDWLGLLAEAGLVAGLDLGRPESPLFEIAVEALVPGG